MSVPIPQDKVPDLEKGQREVEEIQTSDHDDASSDSSEDSTQEQRDEITRIPSKPGNKDQSFGQTLTKIITARSNASVIDPGPPPDGGFNAWKQAFMGHLVVFNTWGMITSYGVFQSYYTTELGLEPSAVAWIGSFQMFGHLFLGMFSGRALDAGFFHWVLIPGLFANAMGMFMTSLCSKYWQFFIAQGILNGIGCGLQFTPTTALVYTYFLKNKSVALAIVASGSATGGLVYPTIARQLLPKIGFAWTTRIMGFIMLAVGALYCSFLKPRLPPRRSGPLLELSAFRETPYTLYVTGVFLTCFGQLFAFYYIGSFAMQVIGVSYSTSVNLLMIMNGLGLIGRLIPSYFADRNFGSYNTLIPFVFGSSIIMFSWAAVKTEAALYAFAVIYGFISAGFQGLFPATLSSLTKDLSKVGVRNGMGFSIIAFANLCGPPIAGALMQKTGGNFLAAQMWGGTMIFMGGVVLTLGRISLTGFVFRVRV
ncbi:major facilitator superfamily domain-containing protein [Dendryphion nanum]|uniref:Major facilitator superfamily domain-containing protein n=1 Tax=Dendryphion nanum TaxID=256645 RepID=A0A9P9EBZ0_9PLEO|nr:major facilitator superfamily domain-containing protein [Dendryphion nanum]